MQDTQTVITRKEYMSHAGDEDSSSWHDRYYRQFVTDDTVRYVVQAIGADRISASTDPHMNDIPLKQWDYLQYSLHFDRDKVKDAGDFVSLSTVVCVAKAAARMWLDAQAEGVR